MLGASLLEVIKQEVIFGSSVNVSISAKCVDCMAPVRFAIVDSPPSFVLEDYHNNTGNFFYFLCSRENMLRIPFFSCVRIHAIITILIGT